MAHTLHTHCTHDHHHHHLTNRLVQVHIAEAGAVPLLVALLRSPKDATRKAAASGEHGRAPCFSPARSCFPLHAGLRVPALTAPREPIAR